MDAMKWMVVVSAIVVSALADCGPDGLRCCLTEFLTLVSPEGIKLTEQNLAASCIFFFTLESSGRFSSDSAATRIGPDTLTCMEDFADQCVATGNEKLEGNINKTKIFISSICPSTSEYMKSVKEYEDCFQNASSKFQSCYNKTVSPDVPTTDDKSKWKVACCEYKDLRDCALQTVENSCGATAAQIIQNEIVNINGAGLEVACEEVFRECGNSAVTLASSVFLILVSLYSIKTFLTFL